MFNTAGVAPLDIRRVYRSMLLATRRSQNSLKVLKQITDTLKNIPFPYLDVIKIEIIQTPPWLFKNFINSKLSTLTKKEALPIIYNQQLHSIIADYLDYTNIFIDGSKMENDVGVAVVFQDHVAMVRLPDFTSIFTAETVAISFALDLIKSRPIHKAVILSDSLSTLRSIENLEEYWKPIHHKWDHQKNI